MTDLQDRYLSLVKRTVSRLRESADSVEDNYIGRTDLERATAELADLYNRLEALTGTLQASAPRIELRPTPRNVTVKGF